MATSQRLILYERHGCHLCEHARVLLDDLLGRDRYQRTDIESDDELVVRYGFRIPVISVDGIDRLEAPIEASDISSLVDELEA